MKPPEDRELVMPRYTADVILDPNPCAEWPRFEGALSRAEFLALERRWSFLARLGERRTEQFSAGS
jgi:hypothetical protein